MIAFRPAALSFRFFRAGPTEEAAPDSFLAAAHLLRWRLRFWHGPKLTSGAVSPARLQHVSPAGAERISKFRNVSVEAPLLFLETSDRGGDDRGVEFCKSV